MQQEARANRRIELQGRNGVESQWLGDDGGEVREGRWEGQSEEGPPARAVGG